MPTPSVAALVEQATPEHTRAVAAEMRGLMQRLLPLPRSITGPGLRATLGVLGEHVPLEISEVPSGTPAFDWTVPDEWVLREAHVTAPDGRRVVDVADSPLHVVGYSGPVRRRMDLDELRPHLHTLPEHPDWVPYRTSYYSPGWGFCLADSVLASLAAGEYEVVIDSSLGPGALTYGEVVLPGEVDDEVLVTAHTCHPALANDNLSGIALAARLAADLARSSHRLTYRFVFAPGTIGALAWLSRNLATLPRIRHGLVLTGLGGPGPLVYKRTRAGDAAVDRAAAHVVRRAGGEVRPYSPYGYDERQFNAPGFALPVGRLSRTPHGEYPQYHTSADSLDLVTDDALAESYAALLQVVDVLDNNRRYHNLSPCGEPQLGRRGLYPSIGGPAATEAVMAMLWVLGYSDGQTSLLEIAETSGSAFARLRQAADRLRDAGLLSTDAAPEGVRG